MQNSASLRAKRERYKERGRLLSCSNCQRPRHPGWIWCVRCGKRCIWYGHPKQLKVTPQELQPFKKSARAFLKIHKNHPGIATAIRLIDSWTLVCDQKASKSPAEKQAALLHRSGIQGPKILPRLLAVAFYQEAHPRAFCSHQAYLFALARAVFSLLPRRVKTGRLSTRTLREGGSFLNHHLGILLLNAARTPFNRAPDISSGPEIKPQPPERCTVVRKLLKSGSLRTDN